jgi:hypothetical protein
VADTSDDDFLLREIDEELQQEKYSELWKAYGNYIIAVVLAIVLGVGGYQGWRSYDLSQRQDQSMRFAAAMNAIAEKPEDARKTFAKIAEDVSGGYGLMAQFQNAGLLAKSGDKSAAAAVYAKISADTSIDPIYRDMAIILGALNDLDQADPSALSAQLAPLRATENPWRHSATELTALLAIRTGDKKTARELLTALTNDATAPSGMKARISEIITQIGK